MLANFWVVCCFVLGGSLPLCKNGDMRDYGKAHMALSSVAGAPPLWWLFNAPLLCGGPLGVPATLALVIAQTLGSTSLFGSPAVSLCSESMPGPQDSREG